MAMTNAERQARWRERRDARIKEQLAQAAAGPDPRDEELVRLREEITRLGEENARLRRTPPPSGAEPALRATIKRLRKEVKEMEHELHTPFIDGDAMTSVLDMGRRIPADDQLTRVLWNDLVEYVRIYAPEQIRAVHRTVERKITKLAARLPSKTDARRMKLERLAAATSGATDGERAAAVAAMKRIRA